jgi:hypothetical protein
METRWLKKNVDMNQVFNLAKKFFEDKGFEVTAYKESKNANKFLAKTKIGPPLDVIVEIKGKPEDFTVFFKLKNIGSKVKYWGPYLSSVGLGILFRHELHVSELYEKLESDFWAFMEEKISSISKNY